MDLPLPSPLTILLTLIISPLLLLLSTYLTTLSTYHLSLSLHDPHSHPHHPTRPPLIPYAIPLLGSTIPFASRTVGSFWTSLRARASRTQHSAFTILLAGTRTHLVFSPGGVSALFRSRAVSRAALDRKLGVRVLGMTAGDAWRAFPNEGEDGGEGEKGPSSTHRLHAEFLLGSAGVELLTSKFLETFTAQLHAAGAFNTTTTEGAQELPLYATLYPLIFTASTTALFGSTLLADHPGFPAAYRVWEDNLLGLLFGVPRLFAPAAHAARDTCVAMLARWLRSGALHDGLDDASDPAWTPSSGARVMRRRHAMYVDRGLSVHAAAGWDLVFLAGIISNATPATGWLLVHILSPSHAVFRAKVDEEIRACTRADGSVDVARLGTAAWLNAGLNEVLRLYVDLLVVRDVERDAEIGGSSVARGEQVMAPSWMVHRDPGLWVDPEAFDPARWIARDERGEEVCRREQGGRFFPFGGGRYMCPGRRFARQEVLGAVAVLLAGWEVEWVGWVDGKGREKVVRGGKEGEGFPGIKKGYVGGQVVGMEGDMKVRIRRRERVGKGEV